VGWEDNLIEETDQIRQLVLQTKRVAVLGIKTEKQVSRPAFYVPEYLDAAGL
jgi:predicted CoA-binding protein